MISYELSKKLKEAGFTQTEVRHMNFYALGSVSKNVSPNVRSEWLLFDDYDEEGTPIRMEWYKVPTLSELIETCGDGIFELLRQSDWHRMKSGFVWTATMARPQDVKALTLSELERTIINIGGSTSEEAVANLWLELNKK